MAADDLPVLIVGDAHGDIERLFKALEPYPADAWHTIFLGDLVDYGMFGVGCLRFARDRKNSDVLLGNHEVAMLGALHDPSRVGFYLSIGGQQHDLDELRKDESLQAWMMARPLLLKLADGTLIQHCGNDDYRLLLGEEKSDPVGTINTNGRLVLEAGDAHLLWNVMSGKGVFATQPDRLDRWLELTGSRRVVFGHTPHHEPRPARYHGGKAINYDGGLARFHYRRPAPLAASVGPLDPC
ncbi:MAG TPA: metallophosphoesterase [Candidatus Dormibacteraeota bacterium]|nr:metallophosphoesterase [Candidatus Dormibacteraeota bacterium]